jgi:integrase
MAITLSDAIEEYLTARRARKLALNTIRADTYILKALLASVGNIYLRSVEARHIDNYFLQNADHKDSTHNIHLTHLKQFFGWAHRRGYIKHDPMLEFRRSHIGTPEDTRLFLPQERFEELLDAAEHPRDRAAIALGLYLFLRVSELSNLKVGDVNLEENEIRVRIPKTKDFDKMPVCTELEQELRRYLSWYTAHIGRRLDPEMYLIPAKSGFRSLPGSPNGTFAPLTSDEALPETPVVPTRKVSRPHQIVQKALRKLGYDPLGEGGHTLRRSGARALFDAVRAKEGFDGALQQVKVMLHHKSSTTTEIYLGVNPERMRRDTRLKGRPMFAKTVLDRENVVEMRRPEVGGSERARL